MRETLSIQGLSLEDGLGSVPDGASLSIERLWAEETVTLLSGRMVTLRAESPGGFLVSLAPSDDYACSLEVKRAVEAAYWAGGPVTLTETLSDPGAVRSWSGLLAEKPTFREVPGSERAAYHYAIKIRQEG